MSFLKNNMENDAQQAAVPAGSAPAEEDSAAKAEEYLAGWKRAMADYANLKKEAERLRIESAKYAAAALVDDLLPVLDGFRKAGAPPADAAALEQWARGIGHIRAQFETVLREAGVAAIDEAGVAFDPARHEAMMSETAEGLAHGIVIRVLESGYCLRDRVLRPAKVVVSS